ncbi:transcriptional regulator, LysR family [Burkholderia sp. YR290]|jgi:LysR family transcriptional regulator (chromosome initiation inhibitor)|uniref:LysR family transcriptional regulator, chromosome initiation inhibitor n=1 Tax=Paraburkholderia steynii TaxID=1245441 RepID=A0A7Z7B524_9BURK|nr:MULTISPECIES: LysR family transcriptional regulator ArgP [Paraburkholderia]EUC13423.1 transcriptional regulator, ArgP, LysR family [Burkholderia sp. BT03]SOE67226.1 transcriptional regulator, LysR family [Burkholderia sp. YR290]SDH65492.1 LysR family transcriptional regulator, chromosome initiation inhibitor [Paraburkholderia steynii]SKC68280.1 transcriptional regulator, LysR family [Paraburkholderia hospita]SKC92900.1 transcriptional regulator, LysR family [Paraburkholderia hospita]
MLDYALLDALAAVVRHGSFDRAAAALNVTPSAVSQRVKLLEERVGSVLVKRGQPCTATRSGALLCRHTERVLLLEAELNGRMPELPGALLEPWPTLRVAVNDDSVGTWFIDAVADFCAERGMLLDLVIDDQDHTAQRIRDGSVQGAVTTQSEPVQGCRSTRLGRMRYRAVCTPAFYERYFSEGVSRDTLRGAPCVDFNPKDQLQKRFVHKITRGEIDAPTHWIPHVSGFLRACATGMGWGMCPERMIAAQLESGELIDMAPGKHLDVDLYWQSWRLSIGWLDDFGAALRKRSAEFLD